jgi:hypothetical protein
MSTVRKPDALAELELFEDGLVEFILAMSETELHDEIRGAGGEPAGIVREFDAMLVAVKNSCALQRLRDAQESVNVFRKQAVAISDAERIAARKKLDPEQNGGEAQLLLAARKGKGASERDTDGLIDDYAELVRLENAEGTSDYDSG